MIITESSIQLYSRHTSIEQHIQKESLLAWRGERPDSNAAESSQRAFGNSLGKFLDLTDRVQFSETALRGRPQRALVSPIPENERHIADLNVKILRELIERLTGKKIDIHLPQAISEAGSETAQSGGALKDSLSNFGVEYDYYESHYEYESTSFSAEGVIKTADGREINFSAQLNMTREFMTEQRISFKAGDALKDPLVVSFSGRAADLTQRSFEFDIDLDGRSDQIAFTHPDSGFLALDKNGDNRINDGSELFGPRTGDGFQELAEYDSDRNGWIDENDSVFEHLRIWMKDSDGENRLFSLGEKGIGAIYLKHIETPFLIKDDENELLGKVRSTGIFVNENGTVGTIQQIDLAV